MSTSILSGRSSASLKEREGLLHFTVDIGHRQISAFLSESVWCASFEPGPRDASLTERYLEHRSTIDAAVAQRVQSGARVPVVLRSGDL